MKEVRCEALDVRIHFWLGENTTQVPRSFCDSLTLEFSWISLFFCRTKNSVFSLLCPSAIFCMYIFTLGNVSMMATRDSVCLFIIYNIAKKFVSYEPVWERFFGGRENISHTYLLIITGNAWHVTCT